MDTYDSSDSDVEEDLGIERPTFLLQIKEILREYRNDVQIIKELIQNADDAGATHMKILYQAKCFNQEEDGETKFRKFLRAPALAFYNDSVFSDYDWKGIRSIYTSDKAHDPLKIGQFGLGFKSIYHMTDFPTILSGNRVMFINPSEQDQNKICTSINLKKLTRSRNLTISDFLQGFEDTFNFRKDLLKSGYYPATIFWFPLRQHQSELSDTIYSETEVMLLLNAFIEEADKNILFARTVSKVEMFIDRPDVEEVEEMETSFNDVLNASPLTLHNGGFGKQIAVYSVEINDDIGNLIEHRVKMNQKLKTLETTVPETTIHWTFDAFVKTDMKQRYGESKESESRWLIVNYLKGGELSENVKKLINDENLCYHHVVGIAARIKQNDAEENYTDAGRVFCNQPLPPENHTGLPVHVNAIFALGNNRRLIKWEDENCFGMFTDKEIQWNHVLVSDILPQGYHLLLQEMINLSKKNHNTCQFVTSVYNLFPVIENTNERWAELGKKFLKHAEKDAIFFSPNTVSRWLPSSETILLSENDMFLDTITHFLTKEHMNFAIIPENVAASLPFLTSNIMKVSPEILAKRMLTTVTYKDMSDQQKEELLQFIALSPSSDMLLSNLELLPLADGSFICFKGTENVFLEPEEVLELFPGMFSKFVRTTLRSGTYHIIKRIVNADTHRVVSLSAGNAAHMINSVLKINFGQERLLTVNVGMSTWKNWLVKLWEFIKSRYKDSLAEFASLPIYPFEFGSEWEKADEIKLCSLSSLLMYFPKYEDQEESEIICQAFELLSVNIVRKVPDFIETTLIDAYITDDQSMKLVQLFERIGSKEIETFNSNVRKQHQSAFLKYVSQIIHIDLTPACLSVLKKLQIFRHSKNTLSDKCDFTSINENPTVFQGKDFPVRFYKCLIQISTDTELLLARKLGADILDLEKVAIQTLQNINYYNFDEKQKFIFWMIKNRNMIENREIRDIVKGIKFIMTESGQWKEPSALFDPTNELMSKMFKDEDLFPKLSHREEALLIPTLLNLGLKRRCDIKLQDLHRTCEIIDRNARRNTKVDEEKAEAFLEFLNCNPELIDRGFLLHKRIVLIKTYDQEDSSLPKGQSDSSCMHRPSDVKSKQFKHLIGSIYSTIDCKSLQNIAERFGWTHAPVVEDVIMHMKNVIDTYKVEDKLSCAPIMSKIYEWLARCSIKRDEVVNKLLQKFQKPNDKFIWNGNEFVSPNEISIEQSYDDLHPFISKLPSELQHLSDFFSDLGCATVQHLNMLVNALGRIKQETESQCGSKSNSSLRKMAITILNKLKDEYATEVDQSALFFPVCQNSSSDASMRPVNECVFCENLDQDYLYSKSQDFALIHQDVPIQTAIVLGVQSIQRKLLSESDFFEGWGQEEPLPIRIRNIIKHGYEDGFAIIKELFQNADDAGADSFYVMFDERENNESKTKLITENMAECQGPAFWVYNDAMFSEKDLVNIRKIGIGTKQNDAGKTGEFGHGFCSVYNITDVPSIISGSSLIIFDPCTTFLNKALPRGSPGVRLDLKQGGESDVKEAFPDQFKPYENVFGCSILSGQCPFFNGTLIRLPLRTGGSTICDTVYTKNKANDLMNSIMELASNLLLFNQNIKKISLFQLPKNILHPSEANLVFEVEAVKISIPISQDVYESSQVLKEICRRKSTKTLGERPFQQLCEINITTKSWKRSENPEVSTKMWLVSWATGRDSEWLCSSYNTQASLPIGSVACIVEKNEMRYEPRKLVELSSFFYKRGHYFCILPTPHYHHFNFHINGKFRLSLDRKHVKVKSDEITETNETNWNEMLISHAAVPAFLFLLESTAMHQVEAFKLWPIVEENDDVLTNCFVKSFYASITNRTEHKVFEHNGKASCLSECLFLDPELREDKDIGDTAFKILANRSCKCIIDIPKDIYKLLKQSNESEIELKTVMQEQFLLEYFLPNLKDLPEINKSERNKILLYAINQDKETLNFWLQENDCIPADDGNLKTPMQLVDSYTLKLARLFNISEGYFPENDFIALDASLNEKLRKLGMLTEVLSNEMILDRVKSVANKKIPCSGCAVDRSLYLLSYLYEQNNKHDELFEVLKVLPFLPVMVKPENWSFIWYGDNAIFESHQNQNLSCKEHQSLEASAILMQPNKLYTCNFKELVGCVRYIIDECFVQRLELQERCPGENLRKLFCKLGLLGTDCIKEHMEQVLDQLMKMTLQEGQIQKDKEIIRCTEKICEKVYDYLEKFSDTDQINIFKDTHSIWINDRFVRPNNVTFDNEVVDCQPYLYNVRDSAISRCPKLCSSLQILETLNANHVADILQKMATDNQDRPCSKTQMKSCVGLLHLLLVCLEREEKNSEQNSLADAVMAIYIPDENSILRDCSKLCLNDSDDIEKTSSMIYVHECIPFALAKSLNIKGKKNHRLEETTEDVEDFYQEEPLCSRLRRLVDGYPFDEGILKELLQNADDAGATEVVFIKDFNSYSCVNVLCHEFKPLQGPSLCVYNNSAFSQRDLNGIKQLGTGSKSDDPSKTGKYGVGFNAVYHITDAPSFYTAGEHLENGETLCIFDPLAQYIPNVTKGNPGKRYKEVQWIRENHSDVLAGYHEKRFPNLRERGTMFRFPLRTEPSEIKHDVMNMSDLSALLQTFCDEFKYSMIFLKYLKSVKVCSFNGCDYTDDYVIETKLSDSDSCKRSRFAEAQSMMCRVFKKQRKEIFDIEQESVYYNIVLRESFSDRCISSSYHVIQTIGFDKVMEVPKLVKVEYEKENIGLLPQGGIAVKKREGKLHEKGKVFCLLPLPVYTGLPVHVNGQFTLDHELRRSLWTSEHECYKTQWNLALLDHVIAKSYVLYLTKLHSFLFDENIPKGLIKSKLDCFFAHFPLYDCASETYWKSLTEYVYKRLTRDQFSFVPILEEFVNVDQHLHVSTLNITWIPIPLKDKEQLPLYHFESAITTDKKPSLITILRSAGMNIAEVRKDIRESLSKCELAIETLSPKHVIDYLIYLDNKEKEEFLLSNQNLSQTVFQNVSNLKKVFDYCFQDKEYFFEKLSSLPIILTQDGVLRRLDTSHKVFVTRFTEFFPGKLDKFVHKRFAGQLLTCSMSVENGKERIDFTQMSQGLLERFSINGFKQLAETEDLFGCPQQTFEQWDQIKLPTSSIQSFWKYFLQQLPDHKSEHVCEHLNVIGFLHLIPAFEPSCNVKLLIKPADIDTLVDLESFQGVSKLYDVVKSFGIIELDKETFRKENGFLKEVPSAASIEQSDETYDEKSYRVLLEQVPKFEAPEKFLRCLVRNITKVNIKPFDVEKASLLLKYFSDRADLLIKAEGLNDIKKLPIFVTQSGDARSVDTYDRVVVVLKDIPSSGLNQIMEQTNVILLRDVDVCDLYTFLDFAYINVREVYTELIFPNQDIQGNHFYDHIDYLCRLVLFEKTDENQHIESAMKELVFIDVRQRDLVRVKDTFYDRPVRKEIFKLFCKGNEMLPIVYHKQYIIDVFERIGLNCDMSIKLFERFASDIAKDEHVDDQTVRRKSKKLIKLLFEMGHQFHRENNFKYLSSIPFIFPDPLQYERLSNIHKPFNSSQPFRFAGAVSGSIMQTCWTTANVLPRWADPVKQNAHELLQKLDICTQPDVQLVTMHCVNIGRSLGNSIPEDKELVIEVMETIYSSLQKLSDQPIMFDMLQHVPMVYFPQGNTIHIASAVVIDCSVEEEVVPYVQKSPSQYGQFQKLFVVLGAVEEPSVSLYVSVINTIRLELEGKDMSHTMREAILKTMMNIFMQLKKYTSQTPLEIGSLYFLSDENVLTNATTLIVDNNRYLHNRLKRGKKLSYMANLEEYAKNTLQIDEIIDCLRKIDKSSRPALLTELLKEEVDITHVSLEDSDYAENIERVIHHDLFVRSVCRLSRHGMRNKLQQQWSDEKEQSISATLLNIRLKHVKGISTNLVLNDELIKNTCESKKVHISIERNVAIVYFDTTENTNWYSDVTTIIVLYLKEVQGCLTDELLFTAQKIFMCRDPNLCEEILDRDGIEAYKSSLVSSDRAEEEIEKEREPRHCYSEAERWQRQAQCDLDNAFESLKKLTGGAYNWVCYQAHQAAEKSLKAAWFAKDANKIEDVGGSHCLVSIAHGLSPELERYAQDLVNVTDWHTHMRYPNAVTPPKIPSDCYGRTEAKTAVKFALYILHGVKKLIMVR